MRCITGFGPSEGIRRTKAVNRQRFLYYPDHRLVIEYDGATHKESLAADHRRQNLLIRAGYTVLRFTASDVLGSPDGVVALLRSALSASENVRFRGPGARPGRSGPRPGPGAPQAA